MGAAFFYHLTRSPLEDTLPVLLDKARGAGWRVVVRGADRAQVEWLDQRLWLGPEEAFLPHGLSGGPHDAAQPILLSHGTDMTNDPACLMSVGGAVVQPAEVTSLERVCILFDGGDAAAVEHARTQWKSLTGAGCSAQYWSEEGGRWQKKAESGGD